MSENLLNFSKISHSIGLRVTGEWTNNFTIISGIFLLYNMNIGNKIYKIHFTFRLILVVLRVKLAIVSHLPVIFLKFLLMKYIKCTEVHV